MLPAFARSALLVVFASYAWQQVGVWELIHCALLDWLARYRQIDWSRAVVDSCSNLTEHPTAEWSAQQVVDAFRTISHPAGYTAIQL